MSFKAPYLSKDELRQRAEQFLERHNPNRTIPVPIEFIIESDFAMDIVPVPGLQAGFDVVAFITKDMSEIRVDEYVYMNRLNRYRFSLAHELAHRILHPDLWEEVDFDDVQLFVNPVEPEPVLFSLSSLTRHQRFWLGSRELSLQPTSFVSGSSSSGSRSRRSFPPQPENRELQHPASSTSTLMAAGGSLERALLTRFLPVTWPQVSIS